MTTLDLDKFCFFEFGPFRLDLSERLLFCEGKLVSLGPKLFETLVILVENRGRVLEKDELIRKLWPDSFVEEGSLSQNIFQLRKTLEEDESCQYIETIPRRGYRFAAEVREVTNSEVIVGPDSQIKNSTKTYLPVKSLAVLPFKSLGNEESVRYLGLGMADATIVKLSGLEQLLVLPTSTIINYAGGKGDTLAIGRKLGVDAVLDGTVQHTSGRVRVTVQLIELESGKTLWSDKFDEQFVDIFAVQDSISEQVATSLALRITNRQRQLLRKRYTENTEAYQTYLMGLFFWRKKSPEGLCKAIEYFKQAIENDPSYALAYAGLADCYFWMAHNSFDNPVRNENFAKSRATALASLELDPFVAEAHAVLGTVQIKYDRDPVAAEKSFQRAIAVNPNCAMAYSRYTFFLAAMGRLNEALIKIKRAQELDPLSPEANASLAHMLYFARDYDEAIPYCERALDLEPNFLDALLVLGLCYEQTERREEAVKLFTRAYVTNEAATEPLELLGHVFAISGDIENAERLLSNLPTSTNAVHPYNVALVHAALGQTERAFEWLRKPYANWTERLRVLRFDPRMDRLKSDSRFTAILANAM